MKLFYCLISPNSHIIHLHFLFEEMIKSTCFYSIADGSLPGRIVSVHKSLTFSYNFFSHKVPHYVFL